jgi:Domain of unknown function (DUF4337)
MSAAKTFEEAHERHEHGREGPRWIPVVAATLAVLAAVSGFLSNIRMTAALMAKNEAIHQTTLASDTYAEYQSSRIKFYIAQSAIDAGVAPNGHAEKLRAVIDHETPKAKPLLKKARGYEKVSEEQNVASERLLKSHEVIEVAVTLFEVSIVLVSITALVGSRLLPWVAGIASVSGIVILLVGLLKYG